MEPDQSRTEVGLPITSTAATERVTAFLRLIYGWMAAGLAITALVAFFVVRSPAILQVVLGNRLVFFGLIIAELGLVFFLSGRAQSLAPRTAALRHDVANVPNSDNVQLRVAGPGCDNPRSGS